MDGQNLASPSDYIRYSAGFSTEFTVFSTLTRTVFNTNPWIVHKSSLGSPSPRPQSPVSQSPSLKMLPLAENGIQHDLFALAKHGDLDRITGFALSQRVRHGLQIRDVRLIETNDDVTGLNAGPLRG